MDCYRENLNWRRRLLSNAICLAWMLLWFLIHVWRFFGGGQMSICKRKELSWPERPRLSRHRFLGVRQRWWSGCGRFLIERYRGGSRRYITLWFPYGQFGQIFEATPSFLIGPSRLTLTGAKAACERKAQELSGTKTPAGRQIAQ
jgi:hypothetical protein